MLIGLYGERLESTMVRVTGTGGVVMRVPALSVSQGQPPHEVGRVAIAAVPDHELEMIRHHSSRKQQHVVPDHNFSRDAFEGSEIALVGEDGESGVGRVQGVINKWRKPSHIPPIGFRDKDSVR
jgi:hypothetical protein